MSQILRLASQQTFSNIDIETSAQIQLHQAVRAFHSLYLAKSANLFLKSWRKLRNEYEEGLYKRLDYSLPPNEQMQQQDSVVRKNKGILLLSFIALHDLARTCSRIDEEYRDEAGKCKLDVHTLRDGWKVITTTEVLEIEEGNDKNHVPWPVGSDIAHVLPLKDPLGRLLEEAGSFKEAAFIIANICSIQLASATELLEKHREGLDFIRDSLSWIRRRTSCTIVSVQAPRDSYRLMEIQEDDEDERNRKKLGLKMNDQFHITERVGLSNMWEKETNSDSEQEEKIPLLRSD